VEVGDVVPIPTFPLAGKTFVWENPEMHKNDDRNNVTSSILLIQ
jgi:hypothetical protein